VRFAVGDWMQALFAADIAPAMFELMAPLFDRPMRAGAATAP
jgi:hypothetical protein